MNEVRDIDYQDYFSRNVSSYFPIKVTPLKSNTIETAVSRESIFISIFFSGFTFGGE
jgi:hypothetical protein